MSAHNLPELLDLERIIALGGAHVQRHVMCEVHHAGRTWPVLAVTLGNPSLDVPAVGFFGGVHGLERIGAEVVIAHLASLIVRLVPSAPFIVVNMAAGVTPMRLSAFALGTGIGILPKIALTAFAGGAVVKGLNGGGGWTGLVLAAALWIGSGLLARSWMKRRERQAAEAAQPSEKTD